MRLEKETEVDALRQEVKDLRERLRDLQREQTDMRRAQDRETHLKKVLLAIRNVNQLITAEDDPARLIERACETLTETLGYPNAWIALLDKDEANVSRIASSGFDRGFEALGDRLLQGAFPGCMERALAREGLLVVSDPPTQCTGCPLARGYAGRAGISHRLAYQGRVHGLLAVSVPAAHADDAEEQALFQELADDLGFALHKIEAEAHRRRLEHIVTTIPQPMSFVSREYRYLAVNDVYAHLFGVARERIIGHTVADFCGRAVFDADIKPEIDRALAGESVHYEVRVDFPGRGARWMAMDYFPYRDEQGDVTGVVSHGLDITDRKHAEGRIRESEEKFRLLFENSDMFISVYDRNGICRLMNRRVAQWFGGEPEDFIGTSFESLHPDTAGEYIRRVRRAIDHGVSEEYEDEVRFPRGSRWLLSRVHPVPDARGVFQTAQILSHDITVRKEAEESLRKSEERFRQVYSHMAVGVAQVSLAFRIEAANEAYCRMLGYDESALIGKHLKEITHPETLAENLRKQSLLAAGEIDHFRMEKQFIHKSGRIIHGILDANLVRDTGGRPQYFLGSVLDITERKRTEAEKARLEGQFHQAQKMESIGRLAGGVAHDLNNLLSPILGYGEMLLEDTARVDPRRGPMEEIVGAGRRARDLVRQLLAFSRKQTLEFKPIDVNLLLGNFEKLLRRTIREDVDIRMNLDPALPPIQGDLGQLEQVVMNLAVNAQDAMPDGGALTIETARVELDESYASTRGGIAPGPYVMMGFSDTGRGMDPETREHLFEPFFTTKEKEKGTGLGLATVFGIIKQHGGQVWAYSEPHLGATFKIYLPVSTEPAAGDGPAPARPAVLGGSETVLLVEDNESVRNLALSILRRQGYTVLAAENGRAALALLDRHDGQVDLLLTDVVMPEMNGRQLFEALSGSHPRIKVLYMSGYTDDVIAHRGVMDPGVAFIQKPFSLKALAAKVREVLDR